MSRPGYSIALVASWILFFLAQVLILRELPLTLLALALCALLLVHRERGEVQLFLLGMAIGAFIEIGLGQIARSQHWEHASLLGVPFWLPLVWGYGFVVIRRIGNVVVDHFSRNE